MGTVIDFSKRPERNISLALVLVFFYTLFAAMLGAAAKYAANEASVISIALWRNLVGTIVLFVGALAFPVQNKGLHFLHTPEWKLQTIRSVSSLIAVLLYFYSLKTLPLAEATLLLFTIPIFVPLVALIWHKVRLHREMWWGLIVSFAGIAVALNPGKSIIQPAALLALLSGVMGAIAMVSLRFSHYSEPAGRTMFYNFSIAAGIMIVVSLFFFPSEWKALNGQVFVWLVIVGVLALVAQMFLTFATRHAPIRLLSPFFYLTVIFSILLDRWIWKTELTKQVVWGSVFIILGNVLMLVLYPKDDLKTH